MLEFGLAEWVSIVSTAATLLMVIATWKMAKVTQLTLEEQNKPYVIVYVQMNKNFPVAFDIVIENIGSSPAYDVKFVCSDNLYKNACGMDKATSEPSKFYCGALINGIQYLPPRGKRIYFWGQFGGISESLHGKPVQIITTFMNSTKVKQYSTDNILDMKDFEGVDASDQTAVQQLKILKLLPEKFDALIKLLDNKLRPQAPETTYTWAYVAWKLLEADGLQRESISSFGRHAGLTEEQMVNAENAALALLREYRPDICPKER